MKSQLSKQIFKYIKTKKFHLKTKKRKVKIAWFPAINSENILARELSRCIWYLFPVRDKIDRIVFFLDQTLLSKGILNDFSFPEYVDASIPSKWFELQKLVQFQSLDTYDKTSGVFNHDLIVEWERTLNKKQFFPYVIQADTINNQFEANRIIQICNLLKQIDLKNMIKDNHKRFIDFISRIESRSYESVLLIGSEPSVQELKKTNRKFSNSLSIVCNSIVKNDHIFNTYKPKIIVASDAVFHSGYSAYASEFRRMVIQRMLDDQELIFIVPLRDYIIYRTYFPDILKDRIIGVPVQKSKKYNFNILNQFCFKSTSNILTLMMMPLGIMLSRKVFLIGFDGRTTKDIDIFWSYDKNSQFQNIYDSTKVAHPGFYKVNYQQYYEKHCEEIQNLMDQVLVEDVQVEHITFSHIPAFSKPHD